MFIIYSYNIIKFVIFVLNENIFFHLFTYSKIFYYLNFFDFLTIKS